MTTKNIDTLRIILTDWEQDIQEAIHEQLLRIGRPVGMSELSDNLFSAEFTFCTDGILLEQDQILMYSSLADTDRKSLSQCMSDSDIDSWGLLGLLDLLRSID